MPEVRHLDVITGWVSIKPHDANVELEIDNADGSFSAFLTREQVAALRDILEDILK